MADKKISQLTAAATPLAGTEVLPIVQSGSTVKVSSDDLTVKNVRSNATTGILQVAGPGVGATRTMTVPDANFTAARTDAGQTFTGTQVMTSPRVVTSIDDTNGNEIIGLTAVASAVNEINISNAAASNVPEIATTGADAAINLNFAPKGGGAIVAKTGSFYVQPTTGTSIAFLRALNTGGQAYIGLDSSIGNISTAYALNLWHTGNYPIVFGTNDAQRGRWDTSGNLRIDNGNLVVGTAGKGIDFSANSGNILTQYKSATHTPTWTGSVTNPAIGNGTLAGNYVLVGKSCTFQFNLEMGSTTTFGSGNYVFSAPIAAAAPATGTVWAFDNGVAYYIGVCKIETSSTDIVIFSNASGQNWGATVPFTWGNTDRLVLTISYIV